jgi:hypothetical protein
MVEVSYEAAVKVYALYGALRALNHYRDIPDERCEEEVKLP